jgi:ATP-dependent Lon protease
VPVRKKILAGALGQKEKKMQKGVAQPVSLDEEKEDVAGDTEKGVAPDPVVDDEPKEQHYTIFYNDVDYSYETIIGPYLKGAKEITVEDPYIRYPYQIQNFVRFCEAVIKLSPVQKITLITSYDDDTDLDRMKENLAVVKQSLLESDVKLTVKINKKMHDREIRIDNGWVIKIGRGLDIYQKPESWYEIGAHDLSLRKCLETKVDIFKIEN